MELENINSKCIMSPARSESVRNVLNIGLQVHMFCEKKLVSAKHSIYDTISQNKLSLLRQTNTLSTPKCKLRLRFLKSDCQLSIASQAQQADLDELFAHKNQVYPVSLSE